MRPFFGLMSNKLFTEKLMLKKQGCILLCVACFMNTWKWWVGPSPEWHGIYYVIQGDQGLKILLSSEDIGVVLSPVIEIHFLILSSHRYVRWTMTVFCPVPKCSFLSQIIFISLQLSTCRCSIIHKETLWLPMAWHGYFGRKQCCLLFSRKGNGITTIGSVSPT